MTQRLAERKVNSLRVFLGNVTKYVKVCCVVTPLQLLVGRNSCKQRLAYMRSLPLGTVGHDLAKMLDRRGLKLIPGFDKHDLNHLVLGYDMTPEEELCMQAYLLGNGHWKIQCFLFLSSAVIVPGLWSTLWNHYRVGRRSAPLSRLRLEDCMERSTAEVQRQYAPSPSLFQSSVSESQLSWVR